MAFCPNCGSQVEGSFCANCGTPMGAGAPRPGAAPASGFESPALSAPGLTDNVAGALCYLAGFITGIIFLVISPYNQNKFVRFHAFQSIFFNVAWIAFWIVWMILGLVLSAISHGLFFIIQLPINLVVTLGGFCLWAYLMYTAYQGKTFQIPVIGPLAAKQAGIVPATGQRL
jgi:uncharacterized membrane protein